MTNELILAIDQGTTNTKALLFDSTGTSVFSTSSPVQLIQPKPSYVEQDPVALWDSVCTTMRACAAYARSAEKANRLHFDLKPAGDVRCVETKQDFECVSRCSRRECNLLAMPPLSQHLRETRRLSRRHTTAHRSSPRPSAERNKVGMALRTRPFVARACSNRRSHARNHRLLAPLQSDRW